MVFLVVLFYRQRRAQCPKCLPPLRFCVTPAITERMVVLQKKPYTAITVQVDRLTGEQYDTDDWSGIPDLVEVIRLQDSGPTEAARALRKKLYVHQGVVEFMRSNESGQEVWKHAQTVEGFDNPRWTDTERWPSISKDFRR